MDEMENSLFDIPDYDQIDDEPFAAFPPPPSPGGEDDGGQPANGMEDWDENQGSPKEEEPPKPTKKTVKRNIPKLDADRLVSERGLPALRTLFADTKFKGKGHEVEDLKLLLRRMEHWAHRLYPKLGFEDFITKLEVLGNKKPVQTCLKRIRLDMPIVDDDFTSEGGKDAALLEGQGNDAQTSANDDFDMHLSSADPNPFLQIVDVSADSQPPSQPNPFLGEETRLRIERNKRLALERRLAKIQSSSQARDLPSTPPPLLVEEEAKKVQELETFGEDMDAEFLDALVAAETEAAVKAGFGDTATVEEVDKSSTDLASSYVCQLASSDNFVAHSASQEGSETAVVREGPETIPMDVALEVAEKPEEPLDTHVPTKVPCQDVDLVTARRSTELAEECADSTGEFQDHKSMENVEKSPDVESCDPEASATGVPLGNPTDDPSAMEPSAEMLVSGISMNTTGPEAPNLSVEITEAAV